MFHFVFQNSKHRMHRHDPRRGAVGSTRGNFNLDYLRKTLGDDFQLYGYETHPIQRVIASLGLSHEFMQGHVLAVQQEKTAMWIRLNPENFCRPDVKLIELYQGLDLQVLKSLLDQYQQQNKQLSSIIQYRNASSSISSSLHRNSERLPVNSEDLEKCKHDVEFWKTRTTELLGLENSQHGLVKDTVNAARQHMISGVTKIIG